MAKKDMRPIFWICGNYYDSRKSWKSILSKLGDVNIISLDCGSNSDSTPDGCRSFAASDVILRLKSKDMFDKRPRILRMRGLPPDYALISDYLKYVNDNNVLVIDSPIGYHDGRKFVTAATSNFYKTISNEGMVIDSGTDAKTDLEAINWVVKCFEENGRKIEKETAQLLVSMKGKNYDSLYVEIVRLLAYQTKKQIILNDIQECCVPVHTKTAWDLCDSLMQFNLEDSLSHLQSFYNVAGSMPGKNFHSDMENLLGALKFNFLFLLFGKDACGEFFSYNNLAQKVEGYKKISEESSTDVFSKYNVTMASKSEYFKKALQQKKQKIYGAYTAIISCIDSIRFARSEEYIKLCLDSLCMFICGSIKEEQMKSIFGKFRLNRKLES